MKSASALTYLLPEEEIAEFREKYWPNCKYTNRKSHAPQFLASDICGVMDPETLAPLHVRSIRVHRVAEGGYRPIVVSSTDFQDVDLSATWSIERAENYCPNIRLLLSDLTDYLWIPSYR